MEATKLAGLCFAFLLGLSACAGNHHELMQLFVKQMNATILKKTYIDGYLNPRSGVTLEGVQEVQLGVMEYSFVDKLTLFVPAERKCRFILIVQKETGIVTDWRYNGKPEYCTSNR